MKFEVVFVLYDFFLYFYISLYIIVVTLPCCATIAGAYDNGNTCKKWSHTYKSYCALQ